MAIDTQEFHELMMDYRGAHPLLAQEAYEMVVEMVEGYNSAWWKSGYERGYIDGQEKIEVIRQQLKQAQQAASAEACLADEWRTRAMNAEKLAPPAYIGMSQAGLGADAHGYVRGWNDCVDAVKGRE